MKSISDTKLYYLVQKLLQKINNQVAPDHTHNYAGSATPGGSATSADKLSTPRNISIDFDSSEKTYFDGTDDYVINAKGKLPMFLKVAEDSYDGDGESEFVLDTFGFPAVVFISKYDEVNDTPFKSFTLHARKRDYAFTDDQGNSFSVVAAGWSGKQLTIEVGSDENAIYSLNEDGAKYKYTVLYY